MPQSSFIPPPQGLKSSDVGSIPIGANFIIYKDGSNYISMRADTGAILSSSTVAETVIQATIDAAKANFGGHIHIAPGTYNLSDTFTGLVVDYKWIHIRCSPNTFMTVPNGYTGVMWYFNKITTHDDTADPQCSSSSLTGGVFYEAGNALNLWTGIRIQASRNGVYNCRWSDMEIRDVGTGIELLMDDAGGVKRAWANTNLFRNIWIINFVQALRFNKTVADWTVGTEYGFNRNTYERVLMQANQADDPIPTHGIRDVHGVGNSFKDCVTYDFARYPNAVTMSLTSLAHSCLVWGGAVTYQNFNNAGKFNVIQDQYTRTFQPASAEERLSSSYDGGAGVESRGFMVGAITQVGIVNYITDTTGKRAEFSTTATAGTTRGLYPNNASAYVIPAKQPRFKAKFRRMPVPTAPRLYIGFVNTTALLSGDDIAVPGILLMARSNDTVWQIARRNTVTTFEPVTGNPAVDTTIHTFELKAINGGTAWQYSFDNAAWTTISTGEMPTTTTGLAAVVEIQNSTANDERMQLFNRIVECDA